MQITSIANQKGGVGKTTTAVNLARTLSLRGDKVMLVDLDPQGNASLGVSSLGPSQEDSPWGHQVCEGIKLLSVPNLVRSEGIKAPTLALLKKALARSPEITRALLDCPPRIDAWGLAGLEASHSVLIPVQSEFFAMQGLAQMIRIVEGIKSTRNPTLEVEGFLLTMVDWREPLHMDVVSEVQGHMKDKVFQTQIPRDLRLAEATSHGMPVWDYDCSCPGALAYLQLAREVSGDEP